MTDTYNPQHPHEPAIPPALNDEGRCLVCALLVDLATTKARGEAAEANADLWRDIAHKVADDSYSDGIGALRHYYDEAVALRERPS